MGFRTSWQVVVLAVVAHLGCGRSRRPAFPLPPQAEQTARVVPFGVSSPDGTGLYLLDGEGKLGSIDAHTGHTRWTSAEVGNPVLAIADGVFAVSAERRLVLYRAGAPAMAWQSDVVPGPWSSIRKTTIRGQILDGELWEVHSTTGASACAGRLVGRFTLDLRSGRVSTVEASGAWSTGDESCSVNAASARVGELVLSVRVDWDNARRGPVGQQAPRWLDARDATTAEVRWTRPLLPADATEWQ